MAVVCFIFVATDEIYAKAPKEKEKQGAIEYANGNKYVGNYLLNTSSKRKILHGKGTMYYPTGAKLEGYWKNDIVQYGTYVYPDGSVFVGDMGIQLWTGTLTYAQSGSVELDRMWTYSGNSKFKGILKAFTQNPMTGEFLNEIVNVDGDKFAGQMDSCKMKSGRIDYVNGDYFIGEFENGEPSNGKYYYANDAEIRGWKIPAGCIFNGNILEFTGSVNTSIVRATGDKYVGSLTNGVTDGTGTMVYADGRTKKDEWHNGMSSIEYAGYLAAEQERKEAERKRQAAIYDQKCVKMFDEYAKNRTGLLFIKEESAEIIHGASIRLRQLFVGKKMFNHSNEMCECVEIEHQKDSKLIEVICRLSNGEKETKYVNAVRVSNTPNFDLGKVPYPKDLTFSYYEINILSDKQEAESNVRMFGTSYWLLNDKKQAVNRAQNYWVKKYGEFYGRAVANGEPKIGMSVEMVQSIKGQGRKNRYMSNGKEIVTLTYVTGDYNIFLEMYTAMRTSVYTFVNGRLAEYSIDE